MPTVTAGPRQLELVDPCPVSSPVGLSGQDHSIADCASHCVGHIRPARFARQVKARGRYAARAGGAAAFTPSVRERGIGKGLDRRRDPVSAEGTTVSAFARGLDHPRWLYVLPNGQPFRCTWGLILPLRSSPGLRSSAASAHGFRSQNSIGVARSDRNIHEPALRGLPLPGSLLRDIRPDVSPSTLPTDIRSHG
jgi:hypothetical protein